MKEFQIIRTTREEIDEHPNMNTEPNVTNKDLEMLQSLEKLQCLTRMKLSVTEKLIVFGRKSLKIMNLRMKSLTLSTDVNEENVKTDAVSMINQLLESSKNSNERIIMEPLGSLPGIRIPLLNKLDEIHLWPSNDFVRSAMSPPGFKTYSTFPKLKKLGISN